jgi:hypothetical protein
MVDDAALFKEWTINEFEDLLQIMKVERRNDRELFSDLQLKKGNYKKYREELIPLYQYVKHKYNDKYLTFSLEKENSSFDATIRINNLVVEQIEFTFPRDGKEENDDAELLLQQRFGQIRSWGDEETKKEILRIIDIAKKKAKKDYSGKTLLILINPFPLWEFDDEDDVELFQKTVALISSFSFTAKEVFFFILPVSTNTGSIESRLIKIK